MTHATTTPRTENAMEATMTANDMQCACALEDGTGLRRAARTGTPPVRHKSAHGQSDRSRGRTWFGSTTHTLIGRLAASLLLLAGLFTAVPAQAQSPKLLSATSSFSTVTLTYDRTLNSSSVPDKAHFTTSVGTVPERFKCGSGDTAGTDCFSQPANPTITNVEVSGSAVVLTLSAPHPLRYLPRIGEWIPGMYVKYTRRTTTIQSQGGVGTDNSCGQAHIGIPRVSHWRLLGCWHVKGGKNYTGTGVPVTLTSGSLGQLVPRHITDIQISDHGGRNGETVDITVTFGGTAKFATGKPPSVWTPGWCQADFRANTGRYSTGAKYISGANSASLLFRCTIINGPHTSLRIAPNSVHDGSNTLKISGTVTEYSYDYNVLADLRHGAVVKMAETTPPTLVDSFTDLTGAEIHFQMSEDLDLSNLPPASAFMATVDGSDVTVTAVGRGGAGFLNDTVKITVSPVVRQGQAVVAAYADPTAGDDANAIQDVFGNDAASFTTGSGGAPAVNNQSTVSMQRVAPTITGSPALSESGSDGTWTAGATVEVTLTFSEAVTVDTTDGTPSIGLDLGGTESRSATYLRGSGTTALVFGYTLVDADGSHTSMLVPIDSLALNGGAIRSQATGADAALSHNGAAMGGSTGPRVEEDPFTARFEGLPQSHDGSSAFTVELHFSEAPEGLSYTTVAGGLLDVTGATVNGARRLTAGSNLAWEVTVTPSQSGDIAIRLPARACTETNAVCASGRALASAVSATVPGIPLTASFSGVPAEHDGTAFEIRFHLSEEPTASLSYRTVQNGLFDMTGASIEKASRLHAGKNNGWSVRIEPSGLGDVRVRVKPTTACDTAPGVCTTDGRKLAGGLQAAIAGPAVLSVADAEVEEAPDATLDFVVTLSKQRFTATTVAYATSDGTATAGSDYTSTSGTLTFGPLETSKSISVPVLDDAHDEGSESLTLTLSNAAPSAVRISDATATGTISNSDPMPKAWMTRFGRTVGSQVVDALGARLAAGGDSHVTMGGMRFGVEALRSLDEDVALDERERNTEQRAAIRTMSADELLRSSAFHLSSGGASAKSASFSAWGRVSTGGFDADVDDVALDGRVTSALFGADAEWDRVMAGVMLSRSSGDGDYRLKEAMGDDGGSVESTLTGVYPYARLQMSERVSAWAIAGLGSGDLTLERSAGERMETDLSMRLGALGVQASLLEGTHMLSLNLKSDALWVDMESDATQGLVATQGESTRLRLLLEGNRAFAMGESALLTPSAEIGVRLDGGDAESGAGIEAGAGLRYSAGPLSIEGAVRTLLAHEESGYEEWGASAALRLSPSASGRGLSLTLSPAWGNAASATQRLWSARDASALGFGDEFEGRAHLDSELGYGFPLARSQALLTPYAGLALGEGGQRAWRGGARWQLGADIEARMEATHDGRGAHAFTVQSTLRF